MRGEEDEKTRNEHKLFTVKPLKQRLTARQSAGGSQIIENMVWGCGPDPEAGPHQYGR
jgi:hypothetical protein